MENTEESSEHTNPTANIDLVNILQRLDTFSDCMEQLALRAQLKLCELIVCVGHPDKLAFQKVQEAVKQQQPPKMT